MKITELLTESAKKGLYYYVNKRKKAGTSRSKNNPKAPSEQDWKNAAKTAKNEGGNPRQAAIAIAKRESGKYNKDGERIKEDSLLDQEFDLIESIIEKLAEHNGVDAEVIWEDLESLTEDELYAFAVTSEPIMEDQHTTEALGLYGPFTVTINTGERPQSRTKTKKFRREDDAILWAQDWLEDAPQYVFATAEVTDPDGNVVWTTDEQGMAEDWQKANKRDKTDGMSQKAVNAYRRENPGSKLKTAVTTKPSKLKKGSKASKRRSSYCSRSRGQMKMHSINCSKTPDKAICKARRRWNC